MADILIRGMEMPTGCASCDFAIYHADSAYHYCFWLKKVFIKPDARLKDCPLNELPPHGDLIDRDALMADGWRLYKGVRYSDGSYATHEMPLYNPGIAVVISAERSEDE